MRFTDFVKQAKAIFSKIKWSQEQLVNGMLIEYDGDSIDKTSVIYEISPDGAKSLLPDGQYKTKSGCLFVLTDGKVSSVTEENTTSSTQPTEPIKQAQSNQEQNIMNKETKISEVKADAEEMKTDPVSPADASTDTASPDTPNVGDLITQALAPINDAY